MEGEVGESGESLKCRVGGREVLCGVRGGN